MARRAYRKLDEAVFAAYGWQEAPADLPDAEIVARLLALNLARATVQRARADRSRPSMNRAAPSCRKMHRG
jgi:hypothetical protein